MLNLVPSEILPYQVRRRKPILRLVMSIAAAANSIRTVNWMTTASLRSHFRGCDHPSWTKQSAGVQDRNEFDVRRDPVGGDDPNSIKDCTCKVEMWSRVTCRYCDSEFSPSPPMFNSYAAILYRICTTAYLCLRWEGLSPCSGPTTLLEKRRSGSYTARLPAQTLHQHPWGS